MSLALSNSNAYAQEVVFVGNTGYELLNNRTQAVLKANRIENRSRNTTTGTLHLRLWATESSSPTGRGYVLADANLSYINDTGQLAPGGAFTNIEVTVPLTPPPDGTYHLHLFVAQHPDLFTALDTVTFRKILTFGDDGGGGEAEVVFVGTVGYELLNNRTQAVLKANRIENRSRNTTTGTLHLRLWATESSSPTGRGYVLADANLSYINDTGQLAPGGAFTNIEVTVPLTPPPDGTYHLHLLVAQHPDLFTALDTVTFRKILTFGRTPPPTGPANDLFSNATRISGQSGRTTGNNVGATVETREPGLGSRSVWWQWRAPQNGAVTIDTSGSSFDTTLGVYTGSRVSALIRIVENDDADGQLSRVVLDVTAGTAYRLRVAGFDGATGIIVLNWNLETAPPPPTEPANDLFSNAIRISGRSGRTTGNNVGATVETREPGLGSRSVWWQWRAPQNGAVTIDTSGSSFDTTLGVYTGSRVSALIRIVENDDADGQLSRVVLDVTAGTAYRLRVAGFDGATGIIVLNWNLEPRTVSSRLFVPIVLRSRGQAGSFFTSELTLTNRGTTTADIQYIYTASFGGGTGTAMDSLGAGQQRIIPDAIAYLTSLGVPIGGGSAGGTLVVDFSNLSSPSDASVTVRVSTPVEDGRGRAGLAYFGLSPDKLLTGSAFITGLRQNSQDRSNVAVQNAGGSSQGSITLRVTVFSGDSAAPGRSEVLPDRTLAPGGFHQYNGILNTAGFDNGYVKVERVSGTAAYYAYGVINDNFNSDGSFVFPVREDSLVGRRGQTLPVIIETGTFNSELTVTNFSPVAKTVKFSFVGDAVRTADQTAKFSVPLKAGQQEILPNIVNVLRQYHVPGVGPAGPAFVGAVFAATTEGDMSGIVIGARTGSPDKRGGQYSLFYNGVPYGAASVESAWIYGLQQNEENRSNLALVNTGEIDDSSITLEITIYDGSGESQPRTRSVTLGPRRWTQENGILGNISQGYVQVRKISGNNPFVTYGVVNDGGRPGQRSGDGAYLPARE